MRAARALRIPYKIRSVVATTIAPALTATIVILAGMYLFLLIYYQGSELGWTHSGASLAWKVCGPIMLAILNAAETRELPATYPGISIRPFIA